MPQINDFSQKTIEFSSDLGFGFWYVLDSYIQGESLKNPNFKIWAIESIFEDFGICHYHVSYHRKAYVLTFRKT